MYKVEAYLRECLVSLASQTFTDFEVVLVDDGSPDGCADIAAEFAARDPRFRLVRQQHAGPGPARNTGVRQANGAYLTFVDGDDIVARHAYDLLVGSLETTGSDIAAGNVARFNSGGVHPSFLHAEPFRTTRKKTHVTRRSSLLYDRTPCNNVFRRAFWDAHGLEFPPGLYEDIPVMVPAQFLARSVDVFQQVVYYWREREDGASTTQRRTELPNMTDRLAAVRTAADFLHANAGARLAQTYDKSLLTSDLQPFLDVLDRAGEEYVRTFRDLVVPILDRCPPASYDRLPVSLRLKYHLLREGRTDELFEVLDFEKSGRAYTAAPVRRRGHWHAGYPFLGDARLGVPDTMYRLADWELEPRAHLDDVSWRGGRIHVTGHAYVDRLGAARPWHGPLFVKLCRAGTRDTRLVRISRRRRPDITGRLGQAVSYDRSGFEFDIDPARLGLTRDPDAVWEVHVAVSARGARRRTRLGDPMPGRAEHPDYRDVAVDGKRIRIRPTFDKDGKFVVRAERISAELTGHSVRDGRLELAGLVRGDLAATAGELVLRRRYGAGSLRVPLTVRPDCPSGFTAAVELGEIVSDQEGEPEPGADPALHDTECLWEVSVRAADGSWRKLVTAPEGFTERWHASAGREVGVTRTRHGHVNLIERRPHLVVDALAWTDGGALELRGGYAGPGPYPDRLTLRRHMSTEIHDFPLTWHTAADGLPRFTAVLTPGALSVFGRTEAIGVGVWDMSAGSPPRPVRLVRHLINDVPGWRDVGLQQMAVRTRNLDALRLSVRRGYADDERGRYYQQRLRTRTYPALRRRPLRDLVVLQSYNGRQYSCNPRAVSEHLARHRPDLELCWVTGDGRIRAPEPARTVLAGTRAHHEALASATYLISNWAMPDWLVKRPGQIYVQTWHGSPLKRIGFTIEAPSSMPSRRRMEALARDAASWDFLVSQSPFTTPILREAFRYDGHVAEIGYPRTDVLHGPSAARRAALARARLGISADQRVILYAPTWRDQLSRKRDELGFEMLLDLDAVRAALGPDHVLLVRAHYLVNRRSPITADGFVRDVSAYPDVNELFLAADVLVTDYSSAMFDYAGLGRPILLFAPDLDQYRDSIRGMSFPIEEHAPGPILHDNDEAIDALLDIDAVARKYADDLARFRATFCPYDDGHATERLIDLMLTPGR